MLMVIVILEMFGYMIKKEQQYIPPWKMSLDTKIKVTWTEVSQLVELKV